MPANENWDCPVSPDAEEILQEAVVDTGERRYAVALKKFRWFHDSATFHNPDLSGVRLSFALAYWMDLAGRYHPALAELLKVRDNAERNFLNGGLASGIFEEVAAINERLNEHHRTALLFTRVAGEDVAAANKIYRFAERSLIQSGNYMICAAFLDGRQRVEEIIQLYIKQRGALQMQQGEFVTDLDWLGRKRFGSAIAALVALLARNHREADAEYVVIRSLEVVDDVEFRAMLNDAIGGTFPNVA